jgi:hypothetical protein
MPDALLARAELAIQEARKLRDERDRIALHGEMIRAECRRAPWYVQRSEPPERTKKRPPCLLIGGDLK